MKKDRCGHSSLSSRKSLGLNLAEGTAVVGQAIFAHPVRQPIGTALGAGHDTGSLQLPHGATTLVPALLGNKAGYYGAAYIAFEYLKEKAA